MDHELIGPRMPDGRRSTSAASGPFALLSFAIALLPVRPAWLWAALIVAGNALPWLLLRTRHRRPASFWRLSHAGLEHVGPSGEIVAGYERDRIKELALTAEDGVLTVFHKFGATEVGALTGMGFEPLTFFLTARRLGIPIHVLDGDSSALKDDEAPPPGQAAERRLLDQEAELLAAVHEPTEPRGAPVRLESPRPVPGRARTTALGVLAAVLSLLMIVRIALEGHVHFSDRLTAGCWALIGTAALLVARRRLERTTPVRWTITAESLWASGQEVAAGDIAALVIGPGVTLRPGTGEPVADSLCVLAFDHRLRLLARLPARGLDKFQLAHALDEHGYRVITPDAQLLRPSEYGLDGLPEIFAQVPGGRLVVAEEGLGWADAAGEVVLRMPHDRIGGIELLTIGGHAWLRVYDSDGDEFFAAPLTALRIARTDLRESARRAGLPVNDAEYDAYLSAAFHGTVSGLSVAPADPAPAQPAGPAAEAGAESGTEPGVESGVLLDVPRRSRIWSYGVTAGVCEIVAVVGSLWLGDDLGGFPLTVAWAAPAGLLLGLVGAWLYDRNRSQLRVSTTGIMAVTALGRIDWNLRRDAVGGVGLDESEDGMPKLVVWSPAGRVLRRVAFPPDLGKLRRACERYGLPWGPPDAGRPAPPPPEL
ncbi:hypothetical protein [Actinomadura alba]|uniref:PH domain-containing protein n=1 Tax=Actinomadura alba TaxID=406431 RepID=A0ABR7LLD7_9ACTN|nr:hypothetical protein [Actinomadura alba]MBC6465651.1 hypothetical protein [Actinomadura alba]